MMWYHILYHIWWVHEPAQPAPGPAFRPGFIALQHDHYCTAHNLLQAAFYGSISASPLLAASKYGALRSGLGAVPVRCSLRCCPHSGRKALLIKWKASTIAVNCVQPAPWPTAASVSASSLSSAAAAKLESLLDALENTWKHIDGHTEGREHIWPLAPSTTS